MADDKLNAEFLTAWQRTLATRVELAYLDVLDDLHACTSTAEVDAVLERHRPTWGAHPLWDDIAHIATQMRLLLRPGS